ncbi:type I-G CRISPR-associated RAMP protein Csb1/Cas7g [Ectothiorhodospira mobilis]|uniref:type I-G CRISPR-associated RAMP protein Csb1/Cas7g n=1 Tax=Ectothiorhodospira mobilis TaxID=195064 RepID=UPI001903078C|nr:type I-U CRISPR-associated RAMP protein Csb1/Cas7u [Ectothiorhodospira mobilis]MBK1692673.1 type I-U CRISPR-associated protein Cas7 [Ectothiorhodospira mobilis]
MSETLNLEILNAAVSGPAAAFRCRRRLQPAGGEGDKVFPPTFAGAVYAIEQRRVPEREDPVVCVLLDSVQSQANRMELALQEAMEASKIKLPLVEVDFSEHDPTGDVEADLEAGRLIERVGKITSLQAPHRLADAILRDSELDGQPFRHSKLGKSLNTVSLANATPLFELCPTALLFGMWDSTGPKGGLGPKFERAMVSEIIGIGAEYNDDYRARGVRRDPLEISKNVPVVRNEDKSLHHVVDGKEKGSVRPSEINHSSVPFDSPNSGVTVEYAEQTTTLSLICLRRLNFPLGDKTGKAADQAARTVLAALGLCAATLAFESGVGLRSRSLLWPDGPMVWELLERPGQPPRTFELTGEQAVALLEDTIGVAREAGLSWRESPISLQPSVQLLELVRRSQNLARHEGAQE